MDKIEDLLTIDTDGNKAEDNKKLLRKVKQLLKASNSKEEKQEKLGEELDFPAYSVIGNKLVTIKFDLDTKEAVVTDIKEDFRDIHNNTNSMYDCILRLKKTGKEFVKYRTKGDLNE